MIRACCLRKTSTTISMFRWELCSAGPALRPCGSSRAKLFPRKAVPAKVNPDLAAIRRIIVLARHPKHSGLEKPQGWKASLALHVRRPSYAP